MPLATYGGPLVSGALTDDEISDAVYALCRSSQLAAQSVTLTGNPKRRMRLRGFNARTLYAHVLDIPCDASLIADGYNANFKRGLKTALKSGVRVRASHSTQDLLAYYSLYEQSLERWGDDATSRHSKELFVALADCPAAFFTLWLGEIGGQAIAGAVSLYLGATAYYWHGAFDDRFAKQMPSKAVMHAMVTDAAERGCTRVDLLSSGGHSGVAMFKESMGARKYPFDEHCWNADTLRKLAVSLRHGVLRAVGQTELEGPLDHMSSR
jgi:hypothetical protein